MRTRVYKWESYILESVMHPTLNSNGPDISVLPNRGNRDFTTILLMKEAIRACIHDLEAIELVLQMIGDVVASIYARVTPENQDYASRLRSFSIEHAVTSPFTVSSLPCGRKAFTTFDTYETFEYLLLYRRHNYVPRWHYVEYPEDEKNLWPTGFFNPFGYYLPDEIESAQNFLVFEDVELDAFWLVIKVQDFATQISVNRCAIYSICYESFTIEDGDDAPI
ncbi:hypothetical protein CC78DRAFT_547115 [Lojkania enalia]|uniref:Uncharacterized protein n=1 Tax=Lojkania enalia TaxID=147567 RepID=A0A9P4K2X9_9PLEO|nr:hypothetical protein CC78DRAFT_547115 [Didymosphaeria enalia]